MAMPLSLHDHGQFFPYRTTSLVGQNPFLGFPAQYTAFLLNGNYKFLIETFNFVKMPLQTKMGLLYCQSSPIMAVTFMEMVNLTQQFANRLRDAMLAAGLNSRRSPSGVSVAALAEITGYSLQICRRYLRGEALPEPGTLVTIASKLKVSPGWLLFGDAHNVSPLAAEEIRIDKKVLHHIFSRAGSLYNSDTAQGEVPAFLMELITDLSLIDATEEQSKKIIDLAFASIRRFSQ